ncbi:MAG: FeoB-associated Cys-rich membrane protein [Bacteroidaceae bacterium]
MSLQEIIVIAIVFFCVNYVGYSIFRYFKNAKENKNPCANCSSGCDLKRMMDEKKKECSKKQNK